MLYISCKKIKTLLNPADDLKNQARKAFELRNAYRVQARILVGDRESAEALNLTGPLHEFNCLLTEKMERLSLSKTEAYKYLIKSSMKTRPEINDIFGVR